MAVLSKEHQEQLLKRAGISGASSDVTVSIDEIDSFGDKDSLLKMYRNIASYNKMLNERITLINDSLTAAIPFTRENLYLFCAYTGSGKSTVAANISYPLWKQGKKVLVVSNEESEQDVLLRVACLEKGYNFNEYKKGQMPPELLKELCVMLPEIAKYVKVLDVVWRDGLTTKVEGVKAALDSVKGHGYSCVLIDYYQLIKYSLRQPDKTTYEVLNDLRTWLGQYIKSSEVPVCLFVQLYSVGKKGGTKDIDARIKECSAIVEPATVIIEVIPNWEDATTDFVIHKDRFGVAGHKIVCPFDKGRYLKQISEREVAERQLDKLEANLQEK